MNGECIFTSSVSFCDIFIPILDDFMDEVVESFNILLTNVDSDACEIQETNITVTIIDDGKHTFHSKHYLTTTYIYNLLYIQALPKTRICAKHGYV